MNFPKITIIYASTSGNVETVCFKISEVLTQQGIMSELYRAESTPENVLVASQYFVFATSTWEHGEINPFFHRILTQLKTLDSTGKIAAFVGLGDTRYEQILFCRGADIIKEAFLKSGGKEVLTTLRINGEPFKYLGTTVKVWTERLIHEVKTNGSL